MIKKTLGLLILGLFSIGITNGYVDNRQCYSVGAGNGNNGYGRCYELQPDESFVMGNYTNSVKDFFNFDDLDGHKIFLMGRSSNDIWSSIWRNGDNLYSFSNRTAYGGFYRVGSLNGFCVYNGTDTTGILNTCFYQPDNSKPNYSNSYYYYNYTNEELIEIFKGQSLTKVIYTNGFSFSTPSQDNTFVLCGIYENINKSFCVRPLDILNSDSNLNNLYGSTEVLRGATTQNYVYENYGNDFTDSPLYGQGGNGGSGNETTKPITTHPCMTLNELFALRPQYNTGLCYSSDKIRNGTSFETTTQYSIYELYPTYNDFKNDLNLYHNYCGNYVATQTACQNAFNGKQAEYSLISKLPNNINDKDLYNYCDLALNYDRNTSTCVINSGATTPKPGTEPTYEDIINAITNQNIQNQAPTTGTVFDELCEEGDENCLQNMAVNRNILESLQNIYDKITSLFEKRTGVEGLIPSYIMRLIFLTLFFTILLKK